MESFPMTKDKQPQPDDATSGKSEPGVAQVGNQKVQRPDKVSDRSVPDDIEE